VALRSRGCELDVPVAPRSADECTVVAIVSRKTTQPLKTEDVDIEEKGCRNLSHWSSYSQRRRRESLRVHDPTVEVRPPTGIPNY